MRAERLLGARTQDAGVRGAARPGRGSVQVQAASALARSGGRHPVAGPARRRRRQAAHPRRSRAGFRRVFCVSRPRVQRLTSFLTLSEAAETRAGALRPLPLCPAQHTQGHQRDSGPPRCSRVSLTLPAAQEQRGPAPTHSIVGTSRGQPTLVAKPAHVSVVWVNGSV